jgi:hypothetical protein
MYVFTVGSDRNFFTFEIMEQDKVAEDIAAAKAKMPIAGVGRLEEEYSGNSGSNVI